VILTLEAGDASAPEKTAEKSTGKAGDKATDKVKSLRIKHQKKPQKNLRINRQKALPEKQQTMLQKMKSQFLRKKTLPLKAS